MTKELFLKCLAVTFFVCSFFVAVSVDTKAACSSYTSCTTYAKKRCGTQAEGYACLDDTSSNTQCSSCYDAGGGVCQAQIAMSTGCINAGTPQCQTTGPINYLGCGGGGGSTPVPSSTPMPTGSGGGSGWGSCGSCNCSSIGVGTNPQCRINDVGACVWDPGACGGTGSACGPVNINNGSNISVYFNQLKNVPVYVGGILDSYGWDALGSVTPTGYTCFTSNLYACTNTQSFSTGPYNFYLTGKSVLGSGTVGFTVYNGDTTTIACQGSRSFSVIGNSPVLINASPDPMTIPLGQTLPLIATVTFPSGLTVSNVRFTSGSSAAVVVTALGSTSDGITYSTTIRGAALTAGARIRAVATMSDGNLYYDDVTVVVSNTTPTPTPTPAPPTVDLLINGVNGPISITSGSSATLSWSTTNATSCTASNGWSGSLSTSGSQSTGNLNTSTTYVISCTGPGGNAADSVTVNVTATPTPTPTPTPPTVDLRANSSNGPITIASGTSATLSWSSTFATSCTASNGWTGTKATSGSESTGSLTTNKTYALSCTGAGGSANDSVTINVSTPTPTPTPTPVPPTVDIRINGANGTVTVNVGTSAILSWTSTNATSCTASGSWSGSQPISGSLSGSTATVGSYTFNLSCTGPGGSSNDSGTLVVTTAPTPTPSPTPPTVDLRVNSVNGPISITSGSSATLSWSSTFATSCTASNGWTGTKATSGSESTGPISSNKTYTMTCTGTGGSAVDSVVVNTIVVPQCAQPATFTATPQCSLTVGGNAQVTFSWPYVANADQYDFYVVNKGTGAIISGTDTGFQPGNSSTFNFCSAVGSTCRRTISLAEGAINYEGRVIARSSTNACLDSTFLPSNNFSVSVCPADAWWQSGSGDLITQGDVISSIPSSVVSPNNRLSLDGQGGFPGLLMVGGGRLIDSGAGSVSSTDWQIEGQFDGRVPTYLDFVDLIPDSITPQDPISGGNSVAGSFFLSGGPTDSSGYTWYQHDGDLTITSDIDLSGASATRKIILFVRGNLTFSGKVTLNPRTQYFMALVGKTSGGAGGSISINPSVRDSGATPSLNGIFYCEDQFRTGTTGAQNDGKVSILGSITALGGVVLNRDLGNSSNQTTPAEVFNISHDLLFNYPLSLTFKRPLWQEVAP